MFNGNKFQVHWEPSDRCNSRCPMCPRYDNKGYETKHLSNTEWTLAQFKKAWPLDFLSINLKKILSCGNFGDPCACREFVDIYEYVREVNPIIGLACNTNASLRQPDWWARLGAVMTKEQNKGNYCTFSIDGLKDTNHIYRRNTDFDKIIENAKAYIDAGGVAHWDFIVFRHNEHQVEEARDLARSLGFENFNIKKTTRWQRYDDGIGSYKVYHNGEYIYDLQQPSDKTFRHHFEDATMFQGEERQSFRPTDFQNMVGIHNTERRWVGGDYQAIDLHKLNVACRSSAGARVQYNEIYISADGTVHPCCFLGSEIIRSYSRPDVDLNYLDMLKLDGGYDQFNMHKHNLWDILDRKTFREYLPSSWDLEKGNVSMRPQKCGACCGVEWNCLDFGELGDKSEGYFVKEDAKVEAQESKNGI